MTRRRPEGLRGVRLLLTLSSLSPLFVLLPLKYEDVCKVINYEGVNRFCSGQIGNLQVWPGVLVWSVMVLLLIGGPLFALKRRIGAAKRSHDTEDLRIQSAEDKREHLLAYLFAVFLPLYQTNADSLPAILALLFSILFVLWLFWYLNAYYVNPYFAFRGYRTYLITSGVTTPQGIRNQPAILITSRPSIQVGDQVSALRLGDAVYLEWQ